MEKEKETTYYRFLSEVRAFLAKIIKEPIKAEPSKYLKDRDFTKSKLIKELMNRDILERHEKILDSTNSEEKTAKYVVKYKVKKKDFENKVYKIYIKYFEKNEPDKEDKKKLNEDGEGGETAIGGTSSFSVGSETSRGDMGYDVPMGMINRPAYGAYRKDKKKGIDPTKILGKTITAEKRTPKTIYITEEQYKTLMEMSTSDAGAMGDYTANGLQISKDDPTIKGRQIHVKQFK